MNFSSAFGVAFGIAIMYSAMKATTPDMGFFLDFHGILIVWGGTAAAASISFPVFRVLALFKVFLLRVLGRSKPDFQGAIAQLLELNKKASIGLNALRDALPLIKHEFLREAVNLVSSGILESNTRRSISASFITLFTSFQKFTMRRVNWHWNIN